MFMKKKKYYYNYYDLKKIFLKVKFELFIYIQFIIFNIDYVLDKLDLLYYVII